MKIFLNAGFGDPLDVATCALIKEMGFDGIRTDALYCGPHGQPPRLIGPDTLAQTAASAAQAGLQVQWLISRPLETGPIDVAQAVARVEQLASIYGDVTHSFDVGMEFNHSKARFAPSVAVELINACVDAADDVPVSACLTNNMGKDALAFARQCFAEGLRCDAIGLHPYKTTVKAWEPARGSGWTSRAEEWDVWQVLGAQQGVLLWAPEWGYHCGVSNVPAPGLMGKLGRKVKLSWTEEQQAEFTEFELFDQFERGVSMTGIFQLNDAADSATNPNHEAHYGVRRTDGSLKPIVASIQHVRRKIGG